MESSTWYVIKQRLAWIKIVERSHRTLDEECLNPRSFRKPGPRIHAISRWLRFYNTQGPHSALAWLTPVQKLQTFPPYHGVTHV